jgi:site-specific DNA-methyltransferase (adenine-specific)
MKPYYKNELTTIYKGDCLEVMDYLIEQGVKVDAIITDPPYGTTACSWDNVIPFDKMWERLKLLRKDKCPIVLFGSEPFSSHLRMSNIKEYKYDWIWDKVTIGNPLIAKKQPLRIVENIILFYKNQCFYNPIMKDDGIEIAKVRLRKTGNKNTNKYSELIGGTTNFGKAHYTLEDLRYSYPKNILTFNKVSEECNQHKRLHPTQKPLELIKYLIETYTKKGDLILDFTSGSFTTCVAAEQLNRRSIGIELEQKYCEVGVKRLSQLQMRLDI